MFRQKGRALLAVLTVLALTIPAVSVLASTGASPSANRQASAAAGELNWELVNQAPTGVYYYTIYFPTKDVGYVTGGPDWNNANNGRGGPVVISKTTDGGKTWVSTNIAGSNGWMRGLTCTDADNCWVAGNNAPRILRTANGGKTWTGFSNVSGYTNWLWSAAWTKKGTSILSGTTCYDPADAGAKANWLRSTDGQTFSGVQATPGQYMCYVQWDIECPSAGFCYSAGRQYIWRTQNDGQTWTQTNAGTVRWYGLSCTGNSTCWISGKNPFIKSTTNSGANWYANTVNGMGAGGQFWDLVMLDNKVGYAGGCSNVATDNSDRCLGTGVLYKTVDGETWNPVSSPAKTDIMDLWAFGENDVYLVEWSGKIWHGTTAPAATNTPTATPTETATNTPTATHTPTATASVTTGQVSGLAFNDLNGDALRDNGEPGIAGASLILRQGRTEVASAVTNADGVFRFEAVLPGQYTLEEKTPPAGFSRSPFLATFQVEQDDELTVFLPHETVEDTPEPTDTPTATATGSTTPEATATATPTGTSQPNGSSWGYLPVIVQ